MVWFREPGKRERERERERDPDHRLPPEGTQIQQLHAEQQSLNCTMAWPKCLWDWNLYISRVQGIFWWSFEHLSFFNQLIDHWSQGIKFSMLAYTCGFSSLALAQALLFAFRDLKFDDLTKTPEWASPSAEGTTRTASSFVSYLPRF